jgi:hypothetical protein
MWETLEEEDDMKRIVHTAKIGAITTVAAATIMIPVTSAGAAEPAAKTTSSVRTHAQPVALSASLPKSGVTITPDFVGAFAEAVASAVAGGVAGGVAGAYAAAQFAAPAAEVAAEASSSSSSSSSSGNAFNYNRTSAKDSQDLQFDAGIG